MQRTRDTIVEQLSQGVYTGPELAEACGITRAAVWKHVQSLREDGFAIDVEDGGYHMRDIPEFGRTAVAHVCDAPYTIEYVDRIESTNVRARELAMEGKENVIVLADTQTKGRGRLDRSWSGPSGGIYASLLIRPDLPPSEVPILTMTGAVAVAEAIASLGCDPTIKWPNDVRIANEKVAGILTEIEGEADRVSWAIVGIGINANVHLDDLPSNSTSLQSEADGPIDRASLVGDIVEHVHALLETPQNVLEDWRSFADTIGRQVRVTTLDDAFVGRAIDVTYPGSLRIKTEDGEVTVHAGDCEHLRPAE